MELNIDTVKAAMAEVVKRNVVNPPDIHKGKGGFGYLWEIKMPETYPDVMGHVSLCTSPNKRLALVLVGVLMKDKTINFSASQEVAVIIAGLAFNMGPAIPMFGVTSGGMFEVRYQFIPNGLSQEQLEYQIEGGLWCAVSQYCPVIDILANVCSMSDTIKEFGKFMQEKRQAEGTPTKRPDQENLLDEMMRAIAQKAWKPDGSSGIGGPNFG